MNTRRLPSRPSGIKKICVNKWLKVFVIMLQIYLYIDIYIWSYVKFSFFSFFLFAGLYTCQLIFSSPEYTRSNINISETSWLIIIRFHQKHHWGGGLTVLGFWLDRIRTLVSMATDRSHRVIMGENLVTTLTSSFIFDWFFFILAGNKDNNKISNGYQIGEIGPETYELAALERLQKSP